MSGKIELKTRKGRSWIWCLDCDEGFKSFGNKDTVCPKCNKSNLGNVYNYYPEWYLEITGEDSNKITISPTWDQLKEFIKDVKIHEMRVTKYRKRKEDADKWMDTIKKASKELQTEIQDFENIPDIYKTQEIIK
ncbi:hypothetical protein LCGC14_1433850 [marine sediment metagenome]|uniref:Uncharacterized protein n=1 Tax=marine sediment metagenome TaxID=412755 RepID=A0A0F9JMR2_9ZZZZ